jgi:hypothetical protein
MPFQGLAAVISVREEPAVSPLVQRGKLIGSTDLSQDGEGAIDCEFLVEIALGADREAVLDENGIDELADRIDKIRVHSALPFLHFRKKPFVAKGARCGASTA